MANRETPYETWAKGEGIPVLRGYSVEDVYRVPLEKWERKGGAGALVVLEGDEGWVGAYLCEIPPHSSLKPQKHLFEEQILILTGRGETKIGQEEGVSQTFGWKEYSLFSPPLNTWHQHTNTGNDAVRYVAVTNAPLVANVFGNTEFIFSSNFVFKDRYQSEENYFDGVGKVADNLWQGGLLLDVRKPALPESVMGKRFGLFQANLSKNRMAAHIAEMDTGTYKKAHRHGAGAHIIILNGKGYSLIWTEGQEKTRIDWSRGSMFSPPGGWFHQHFNTCNEPVKQVALRHGNLGVGKTYDCGKDIKLGGDQIEYEDEDPGIRKLFEEELSKEGLAYKMF